MHAKSIINSAAFSFERFSQVLKLLSISLLIQVGLGS